MTPDAADSMAVRAAPAGGRGVLAIVSSPSGAGKTTLTRRLIAEFAPQLEFSVSYTTRTKRVGEVDGHDYWFVTPDRFEQMVQRGEFAEYAWVHDNRYGTAKAPVETALSAGRDVIFDVDWQGGKVLADLWPQDALKIFILPPDLATLKSRLQSRATDSQVTIDRRHRAAIEELEHYTEYAHLIVNDDIDRAYVVLRAIYLTRRWGVVDRPEVSYPLAQLAALVEANARSDADAHARRLVAR